MLLAEEENPNSFFEADSHVPPLLSGCLGVPGPADMISFLWWNNVRSA